MTPVTLTIRWHELFGETKVDMPDATRRERWEQWKVLCAKEPEIIEQWTQPEETCLGCKHREGDWCAKQSLPCTVNPIFTYALNMAGMACMGAGYEPGQMKMF